MTALYTYAGENVGTSFSPGSSTTPKVSGPWWCNTATTMQKACQALYSSIERWMPFTESIQSRFVGPRPITQPFQSPSDFGIGENITRYGSFPSGARAFPYPYEIGAVSGFMPMLDQYSMAWAWGKTPSGPGVLTPIPIPWQTTYPNLRKVTG